MCELKNELKEKEILLNKTFKYSEKKKLQEDINFLKMVINSGDNKKETWSDIFKLGDKAEAYFAKLCKDRGNEYFKSDISTDMKKHIDCYVLTEDNRRVSVDVKAIKKTSRQGKFDDSVQWIEFKNTYGGKGWLYGEADIIAFQFNSGFYLVNRESLVEYCNTLLENAQTFHKKYVKQPIPFYEKYTRHNCKDLVMKVKMKDILKNCRVSRWLDEN